MGDSLAPYLYKRRYSDDDKVSSEDLRLAYLQAAKLVSERGDKYLPIFERLESEVELYENRDDAIKRALAVANEAQKRQRNDK